jgi:L-seryl-tRNA(Ser) seleniumtransferase
MSRSSLRNLPSVDRLLQHAGALVGAYGHALTVEALRASLDEARAALLDGGGQAPSADELLDAARRRLEDWLAPTLRPVINASGVIVHTNLGRAPLSDEAIAAMNAAARGYSTLEYDLAEGRRGSRQVHAEALLRRLSGAEAAMVVNNNAAGVLLALVALAGPDKEHPQGRGVIISRGQLIEIGGGFRVPDVMAQSGARLIEVGTTNRTHLRDYAAAIDETTVAILRAHRSNFRMIGFTSEPPLEDLVGLAREHGLSMLDDLGSGALLDVAEFGLSDEPLVQDSVRAGADVVMFSGDKLLGGPQAGVIVGRAEAVEQMKRHPLARAIRADKLCLAGLSATLMHYLKGEATKIPVWRMIAAQPDELRVRAERWAGELAAVGVDCQVIEGQSAVGGGSLPGQTLPTWLLALNLPSPDQAAARLRACDPPIIARIEGDLLVFDPRSVLPHDEPALLDALRATFGPPATSG